MSDQGDEATIEDRIARCRRMLSTPLDRETTERLRAYLQDLERALETLRARAPGVDGSKRESPPQAES
jgi:hypothetical protein